jgi:hypothetical protein
MWTTLIYNGSMPNKAKQINKHWQKLEAKEKMLRRKLLTTIEQLNEQYYNGQIDLAEYELKLKELTNTKSC